MSNIRKPGTRSYFDIENLKRRSLLEAEIEDAEEARRRARQAAAENADGWFAPDEDDLHPIDPKTVRY